MTDISMCLSETCPLRQTCRRSDASGTRPNLMWQAYGDFERDPDTDNCAAYWPTQEARRVIRAGHAAKMGHHND